MSSSGKRCPKRKTQANENYKQFQPGVGFCVSWALTGVGANFPHCHFVQCGSGWMPSVLRYLMVCKVADKCVSVYSSNISHDLTSGRLCLNLEGSLRCPSVSVDRGSHLQEAFPATNCQLLSTCSSFRWQVHTTQSNDLLMLLLFLSFKVLK